MAYSETSARTGMKVDKVFETMAVSIMSKIENKEIDFSNEVRDFILLSEDVRDQTWDIL